MEDINFLDLEEAEALSELLQWEYGYYNHDYLLSLLSTSNFCGRAKERLENEINDTSNMNKETYDKIIFNLFNNQLDPITSGFSYNQGDIIKHLRKLK